MDDELAMALGDVARAARVRAGLTQADVAERVGIATEVYGRLERGLMLPSVETLRKLSRVLGIAADALLGLRGDSGAAEPPATYGGEKPEVRRLIRRLKRLDAKQLRLISLLASELSRR
ncbi:MAG: helix-turn-helix transcriptional regulator [Deltaproteobacteria bacterium]|nr:helix-turn-helix transcriptional regulator [Deltaproteobacteria bacterium]